MAKWVSQAETSSASRTAQQRTQYLASLVTDIDAAIARYFSTSPAGEDVTLEVLRSIGRERIAAVAGTRTPAETNSDVGLLVAIRLVDLYGASRVMTFRENDGKKVSTRDASRAGLDWVSRYTPHQVLPTDSAGRIVLDTNIVRYIIQGSTNPETILDLVELARIRGNYKVSIADAAWAELLEALVRPTGGMTFAEWARNVGQFDAVLDPELPVLPGGRELAMLSGLVASSEFNFSEMASFYRAVWSYISGATSANDLRKRYTYKTEDGREFAIGPLDFSSPRNVFGERATKWETYISKSASGTSLDLDQHVAAVRSGLAVDMPMQAVDRLGLFVHVVAHYAVEANNPARPYEADINDAVDLDILYAATLPAVVCTTDKRLRRIARSTGSADGWRVMSPSELLKWLRNQNS
ncbi:hypothetical protein [Corallococcus exiguus]|uniref:Uncharacterized protein n=1 Tax=Corallococcus exiguus TaxID=83462 RepID=A0A7X5BS04_9BACT|nr:hypothetical protein [Corallococcus exiguus]NBC41399.1 hypothetical protein [Corallococcus exiguus]TNV67107.1 hypothetical protein FH620_02445 [Corallococcus exiguus]